jgi:hypothetical protein
MSASDRLRLGGFRHPDFDLLGNTNGWIRGRPFLCRHPRGGGDTSHQRGARCKVRRWIPAYAGMTNKGGWRTVCFGLHNTTKQTSMPPTKGKAKDA